MIKEAMEYIIKQSAPNFKEHRGIIFTDKKFLELKPEAGPVPNNLKIKTLSGVVDYIKNSLDNERDYLVHIDDFNSVTLYGKYDQEFCRRKMYVSADSQLQRFSYGCFMDIENFIISILAYFRPNQTLDDIFAYVGKLNDGTDITLMDDGVTQKASIKTGVVSQAEKAVPNPVELIPYETFPEIEGVPRKFVFRLRKGSRGIECAIFESGDTCWKIEYIKKIKTYLEENLIEGAKADEPLRISIIA